MQRLVRFLPLGLLSLLALALSGCSAFSLAADVTPPPGYVTPSAPTDQPVAASTAFPLLPPDPAAGKETFAVKCEPCHGATGLGDGSKADSLPERPPSIGGKDLALQARPADWFNVVSEGNLEKFMPGFKASLNDRQRWDVVAYVLTLSQSAADLETGKALYDAQCASCHGVEGEGGEKAPDWRKQDRLARLSGQEITAVIAAGQASMPAYADLGENELLALATYVRRLTFASAAGQTASTGETTQEVSATPVGASPEGASPEGTPVAQAEAGGSALVVQGVITAQGEGLEVGGLTVTLLGFNGMEQATQETTTSAADGTYRFQVDNSAGLAYMVQVDYKGFTYNSDILSSQDAQTGSAELPVTIYRTTTDTSAISFDRLHIFFDFTIPGTVQVVELYIVSNSGQEVVVAESADKPPLVFKLPPGATDLQFESGALGDRYVQTSDGFGDLAAIGPGQGQQQVLFSYSLPYDKKLDLSIPVTKDVGAAVVMMPHGSVRLQSGQLTASGSRDVQGTTFDLYNGSGLAAGSELTMQLSGKASAETVSAAATATSGLFIGLGAFGLVLIGAGIWFFRMRGSQAEAETAEGAGGAENSVEGLLDAILTLDDLRQAGKLPEDAYQKRRAELKARLRTLKEG
jgi:mono/diheme cytochrome c family protein